MNTALQPASMDAQVDRQHLGDDTRELLKSTHTHELVIALCGPIGSPLHDVSSAIQETLSNKYGYDCREIRLSHFIQDYAERTEGHSAIPRSPKIARVEKLIEVGDQMRGVLGGSVLAELAIYKIRLDREASGKDDSGKKFVARRVCHVINSIKNQAELDLLREVYREVLFVFGVFSPVSKRERNLLELGFPREKTQALMERDAKGGGESGQTVGDTFPQSDFFLRMETNSTISLQTKVERYLDLILGSKIVTPTREESAMYAAASAASSSACLSRQVGAAVTDKNGEILSVGWNDVPKAFGGLYQFDRENDPSGSNDLRCYNQGKRCFNDDEKKTLAEALIETLGEDLIDPKQVDAAVKKILTDKRLQGLIEFSRAIHAEMHAIINAMRLGGDRIHKGKIFVTTYPCHGCARHIVASGVSEVYYIEPYRKSLALQLHSDALTENETDLNHVRILPFEGVAPSRYLSIFQMKPDSRKKEGRTISIVPSQALPKLVKSLQSLPELEALVVGKLAQKGIVGVESLARQGGEDGSETAGA
ncbi:anti-phage dCTP deaminase [Delftia acidovorans]